MPNPETISERCWNSEQSWHYEKTVSWLMNSAWHKLRVCIRRNAYDHQSFARVERWNGEQWHQVTRCPIGECSCREVSYVQDNIGVAAFHADADRLLGETYDIIS